MTRLSRARWHLQIRVGSAWVTQTHATAFLEAVQLAEAVRGTDARVLLGRREWYRTQPPDSAGSLAQPRVSAGPAATERTI